MFHKLIIVVFCSYSGNNNIQFKLSGLKGGIKDLQVKYNKLSYTDCLYYILFIRHGTLILLILDCTLIFQVITVPITKFKANRITDTVLESKLF